VKKKKIGGRKVVLSFGDGSTLSIKGACILVYSSQQKKLSVYEVSANAGYLEKTICLRREIRTQKKKCKI